MSTRTPIVFSGSPTVTPSLVAPFTHNITLSSGPWTFTARLELPGLDLRITPAKTPGYYILALASEGVSTAEVFDRNLASFMGAISTAAKAHYVHAPHAIHHLLQGMAQAMTYFGQQYDYLELVNGDTVQATKKREDV